MPAVSPHQLVNSIINAVQQSGGSAVYLSDKIKTHPRAREFGVHYHNVDFSVWIYIWTLTHGGGPARPEDEYRIQLTTVQPPLALNPAPDGYTVLLGYYPDLQIFAGFDIKKHIHFTAGSSSTQIKLQTLLEALQNGLAFYTKESEEITVAIRPDQFLTYVLNASQLHDAGSKVLPILQRAAASEIIESTELAKLSSTRQRIITAVSRLSRAANFRKKVLDAYGHRCAVTRMQLKLIEAAHILPVTVSQSTDKTNNGIALSPTMHRAFDNALIFLDEDCVMHLNESRAEELKSMGFAEGLDQLSSYLGIRIHLPADQSLWPDPKLVKLANKYRRIPG